MTAGGTDMARSLARAVLDVGGSIERVARSRGIPRSSVAIAARRHGWPDLDLMRLALVADLDRFVVRLLDAEPTDDLVTQWVSVTTQLLTEILVAEEAQQAEEARVRELAVRTAEVEQMRARLAKAEALLAVAEGTKAPEMPTAPELRFWAAEEGIDCPPKGRIPAHVRNAWIEAQR